MTHYSVFVNDEQFSQLQERYQRWKEQGFSELDDGLLPLLEKLNRLPGLVTVSSCVGHQSRHKQLKSPFYIHLAVHNETGWRTLQLIYERMARRLIEVLRIFQANDAGLKHSVVGHTLIDYTNLALKMSFKDLQLSEQQQLTYNCFALIGKGTHLYPQRENFLKELLVVLDGLEAG